ncbi:HNH endonuclease signature motif containing protein [Flavobacterium sp. SUN046]|uniref:HNH endonuclease signature motif containing protein n=1 Tax=Flavobacterium sp. SUN046 TaxID=3002440 RepID=UPI002DBBBEEB|nr:HNH endonuclease signature motif containing protein [Flavobacterium sp. SUN046]MEC4050920.1 HNH endonuclease signature motif containing protein [Flavobacterium sp. SUN046]
MKLYDFRNLSLKLDSLNYPEVKESRFEIVRKDFSEEEKKGNITFKEDGIYLLINGIEHKGYMYIKKADIGRFGFPKFHITNCSVIVEQKSKGFFNGHYFWHNSNTVTIIDRNTNELKKDIKLSLCSRCQAQANIRDYINTQGFFDLLDIQVEQPEEIVELDIFGYVKDWQQISKKFRIKNEYTCNKCSIKISKKIDQRFIQVHHKNGDKKNNTEKNLQCLCILCHANSDKKHIANFQKKRSIHEINSFIEKYKDELIRIGNPFIMIT